MTNNSSSETEHVGVRTTAFNQTCDRLREFLKEKRALQNTTTISSTRTTMNLFPIEKQNNVLLFDCDQHVLQDMTIFYNGRVIVVDNIPCRKADQIIRLATDLSLPGVGNSFATAPPAPSRPVPISNNSVACDLSYFARDVSQTRSRSLTRFFEKRKERINAKAPYTLRDKSWLGLSTAPGN